MRTDRLVTARLELRPLPAEAARALPGCREEASRILGAELSEQWPQSDLLGILPRHAATPPAQSNFGVWVVLEPDPARVVGDIGFHGPPDESGTVEIGYSIVPARRRLGYAPEAAAALVRWALSQPDVTTVVAGCDPSNGPSIRTLERVGFRRTREEGGELRWRFTPEP